MTISYNWLCDYLSVKPEPEELSIILTSIGLEVESLEKYEAVKGSLEGLLVGKVVECIPHPGADKLKLTQVDIGISELLQIVCGAKNVEAGQRVIVAKPGTTIYPLKKEPLVINIATIRGIESHGMICAEDEIGLGPDHEGIIVLAPETVPGTSAAMVINCYTDYIFEIGLTPNHMDAMSHYGVAKEVSAYLSHHQNREIISISPYLQKPETTDNRVSISASIENTEDCQRFSGVKIKGITIKASPVWMQDRLKAIGIRPINNIVDITNFVLNETGQPLHAYDAAFIKGDKIIVKNLPDGTVFRTLDGNERKLGANDLMVCNEKDPMCIAGVFGGLESGVKDSTKDIFLESAWFKPSTIRKTSFRHGLRTDAATHFEKGMDISNTVNALNRAAMLINEFAGGEIEGTIVDVYPNPAPRKSIELKWSYLEKLSGKKYEFTEVKNILRYLGFALVAEGQDKIILEAPYYKPDIELPADVVEEIMRIDGYDSIEIPVAITTSPSIEAGKETALLKEKITGWLTGNGFYEILTNSITNSKYFQEGEMAEAVRMINSLSEDLDIMRPSLLETGLESLAFNINRKNANLRFFEFGKSYHSRETGVYEEKNHLCLYITGKLSDHSWKGKATVVDAYYTKGIAASLMQLVGTKVKVEYRNENKLINAFLGSVNKKAVVYGGAVNSSTLQRFGIKQPVYFIDLDWDAVQSIASSRKTEFTELPKQLPVQRDLAMVVEKKMPYEKIEDIIENINLGKLQRIELFDVFESEKLGSGKKSMAISLSFLDKEKTLTDSEIDDMMRKIMQALEVELNAEIRRQ